MFKNSYGLYESSEIFETRQTHIREGDLSNEVVKAFKKADKEKVLETVESLKLKYFS